MDYEDNDFQSQSFQLAVEENIKFSPGSHSYSLPKFDLDYNLHTHLRFDSLVESEVLLGIRSQEENQWIEDFSRESSGLEFSSGAAESCSVSRRNNVWSEATSSESVDLLLKSVGQDDMIMGQAKIVESDACDGLNSLTNQMEPNSNKDGLSLSETGNATCVGSISTLDVPIEQYPVLGKDAVDQQSQIDSTSQFEKGENVDDKPEGSKSLGDSSALECVQVRTSPASVQTSVSAGELNSDVLQGDEGLEQDTAEIVGDHQVLSRVMDVQTCEWHTNNTDVNNFEKVSNLVQKADYTLQASEVRSHAICTTDSVETSDYEHIIPSRDTDMVDQCRGSSQEASFFIAGENVCVAQSTDFSGGATGIKSMPSVQFSDHTVLGRCNVEPIVKRGVLSENVSHQMDGGPSISNTEELPEKDQTICEGHGNENADDQNHSSSFVREICSSADVSHQSQIPKDRKDRDVGLGVHSAEVCHTSSLLVESYPSCDQLLIEDAPCGVWLSRPDVCVDEKENEGLPSCSESTGVVLETATVGSDNIVDGIQNLIQGTSIAENESYQQEDLSSSSHENSCSLAVREEEIVTRSSIVPSILDAEERSQVSTECFPYSEPEHGEVCDTAKEMPPEIVAQSSSSTGLSGKMSQNEHGSDIADIDVQQQCSERLEESLVIQDVALKDDGPAEYNIEGVPIEVEETRSSHEELQRHPPPSLRESYHDISLENLEEIGASETNSGFSTALESTERDVMASPALTHTLPPSLGEEAEASKSDNSLRSPITSLQDLDFPVPNPPKHHPLDEYSHNHSNGRLRFSGTRVSLIGGESIVGSVAVSESDAEGHILEAESSSLNFTEPNCGSPTTISCSEASQSEKEQLEGKMVSLDVIDSGALEQENNKIIHSVANSKESDALEDDRSFTFRVSSVEELSEKETVSGWKPFPNVHPYKTSQAVVSSGLSPFGSCGIDSKMVEGSGNPRISGETIMPESSKCTSEGKTWHSAGKKTTEKETAEGKPQSNVVVDVVKEHQNELRRLSDANAAVPCSIDQVKFFDVSPVNDPKANIASEVSRRFSFGTNSMENLSEKGTCHRWKPVYSVQPYEFPQTVGVSSPATSFVKQIDANELQKSSRESRPRASGAKNVRRSYKSNAVDKTQSSSGKVADKEKAKGGKSSIDSISKKHTKAGTNNSLSASPTSPGTKTQALRRGEVQSLGYTEGSSSKPCVVTTVQTSNLPDLNSSVSSYSLFQQPFTAFQQVQLRAQIFVYGSIIQGTTPEEACMEAAFGESDGGRSAWENVWRVTVERFQKQKSPLSNVKTPLHKHNDSRSTTTMNQTVHRSEAICTPNTPFSSPTWSVPSTCHDGLLSMTMPKGPLGDSSKTFVPLLPYQSPHTRHYVGNTSPWPTSVPSPGTWVVTPQSAALASVHHPTLPTSEAVRITSVRESVPQSLGMQHAPINSFIHTGSPLSGSASRPLVMDAKRIPISPAKHINTESKPRKRRRNVASEMQGQITPLVQPWRDLVSVSAQHPISVAPTTTTSALSVSSGGLASGNLPGQILSLVQSRKDPISVSAQSPKSVALTPTTSAVSFASSSLISGSSLVPSTHRQIVDGGATEQRVCFSEEMSGKIELAKREAEDAAGLAATAVRYCQNIWTQLAAQKNSGAVSEIEAKLGSSAVAIAAAASVAKAAAAVAKVASDAALQAKLMADEALHTSKSVSHTPGTSFQEDVHNLGRVTPSSILKGRDKISNADSVLGVVREAARKRVEAASAAAKRAENLGALLKAAEMTAEAVSQAGTIIAMGEPLPFTLTELVDAGPEGYWKVQQKSLQLVNPNHLRTGETYKEGSSGSVEQLNEKLLDKNGTSKIVDPGMVLSCEELSRDPAENKIMLVNDLHWGSVSSSGKGLEEQKGCAEYGLSKTTGVIPESQGTAENATLAIPNDECGGHLLTSNVDKIDEGSLVEVSEVRSEEEGLGMVWFLAKVLSLKDGKASVSYAVDARNEGSSHSTEWVSLYEKGDNAPRIRIPHPLSVIKHEGTKKRSRAARGDYAWSVGDKVDALIRNGWWEGIITEKSKDDETYLTIKFSAERETSVVRAWNLRPSLIWEDGKWIEWCRPVEHESDTPQRKPPKKSRHESETDPAVEARGKDKMTKLPVIKELEKPEPPKPLMLSAKEKVFNVGKKTTERKPSDALGTKRIGLQKEGSRVVFGIPKPGKKRKFMDVSRHYVSDKANKLREGSDSAKFTKLLVPQESASRGWKNTSKGVFKGKRIAEPNKEAEGKELLLDIASNSISHKKSSPDVAADLQSKGRAAPLGDKSVKNNEKRDGQSFMGNVMPNAAEPRRSVRRIQPTSRLLEGLQSSLIASKIPASSHDKGTKTQQKSLRGRTHG